MSGYHVCNFDKLQAILAQVSGPVGRAFSSITTKNLLLKL